MISFFVHGRAVPKGSARAMSGAPSGPPCKLCKKRKPGHPYVINANDATKGWEKCIRGAARVAMASGKEKILCAVDVDMVFYLQRPQAHHVAGDRARQLKDKHRETILHTNKPDVDKLARAVLDGLTDICFGDDSTVCRITSVKYYGAKTGVQLTITEAVIPDDVRKQYDEDFHQQAGGAKLVQGKQEGVHQPQLFKDWREDKGNG